jgi:FkbM family methyltransferase
MIGITFLLVFHPESQWRSKVLTLKAGGRLSMLTWGEVFAGVAPANHDPMLNLLISELVTGDVRFNRFENCQCPILWDTPMGSFWGRLEDGNSLEILVSEQVRRNIYGTGIAHVKPGDVVLDLGAHLGLFTRAALQGGAEVVVAFEPDPSNIDCFKRTFKDELARKKVILVEAAAMDREGVVNFEAAPGGNAGASRVAERGQLQVRAITIDDTVRRLGLEKVHFIKMDIEGSERYALAGAGRTLALHAPRMALCIYHREDDPQILPKLVRDLQPNYRMQITSSQAYFF